jgi:outer membrane protein OmpA-like peptidoglycan-associated protein
MKKILLYSLICLTNLLPLQSQTSSSIKENFDDAEYFFNLEAYYDALSSYLKVYENGYKDNAYINYRVGICYLSTPDKKEKAISFLEKAASNVNSKAKEGSLKEKYAPIDALLFLGNAYRINKQYQKAIDTYSSLLQEIDAKDATMQAFIEQEIKACTKSMNNESFLRLKEEKVGNQFNKMDDSYDAMLSKDESSMVYMSSQKFYEAIFYVKKENGKWGLPENITPLVGSDGDMTVSWLSADGTKLLLAKDDKFNSDLYMSTNIEGIWTTARPLNSNVNTKFWESHGTMTADGKTLYFASNRKGRYGGMDIFKSEWNPVQKDWGAAINLGSTINTVLNEDKPFISPDGKRLYFCSQGHDNFGGYDIFYSDLKPDGTWTTPVNVGYPINTSDDELFFCPVQDGNTGYISKAADQSKHNIYRIEILPPLRYLEYNIKGILTARDGISIRYSDDFLVTLKDSTDKIIAKVSPKPNKEFFNIKTYNPKVKLSFDGSGYTADPIMLDFTKTDYPDTGICRFLLNPIVKGTTISVNKMFAIKVIFFDFNKFTLSDEAKKNLEVLSVNMKTKDGPIIQAIGHADDIGSEEYNMKLSRQRAKAIRSFLMQKGVPGKQIKIAAVGKNQPIAINKNADGTDNPEGRKLNRRAEFKILSTNCPLSVETIDVPANLKINKE